MAVNGWIMGRHLRRRWVAAALVALIVGVGTTASLVALGTAQRTATAYARYLERADVSDVVVNPSFNSAAMDASIRSLPGVAAATSDALFAVTLDDGAPRPFRDTAGPGLLQVRGSVDGRYTAMDRPALAEGRYPTGEREALAGAELARVEGIDVGDVVPVSFWWPGVEAGVVDPDMVVSPIGVEHLRVVGLATLPDEVLSDPLYPRTRMIVSPDVAARYDCLPAVPPRDVSWDEALAALVPSDCATSYRYYSLELAAGPAGSGGAVTALRDRAVDLTGALPDVVQEAGGGYFVIANFTRNEQERVERSTEPTVAALAVLGAAAGVVTLLSTGLAVARELRRSEGTLTRWSQLGMTTSERAMAVVVPVLAAAGVALAAGVVAAWLLSPVGPVGNVRSIEPSPHRQLSGWASLGAITIAVLTFALVAALAYASARRAGRPRTRRASRRQPSRLALRWARPEVGEGVRAAYRGPAAALVVASGALASSVFLAAVVFGANLSALVSTPASYGWTWDLAVIGNVGYGPLDLDAVSETLDERDDVEAWSALAFSNTITLNGQLVLSMIRHDEGGATDLTVVDGTLPTGADEVALGVRTADAHDLDVGDVAEVGGTGVARRVATVTGLVVFPAVGPAIADRLSPGSGMLIPGAMIPDALGGEGEGSAEVGFIGIDLVDGSDRTLVQDDLRDEVARWDPIGVGLLEYAAPIKPPEIEDARSIRAVPLLVGGLLMVAAVVGLTFSIALSVRARRRELALLRALGFTRRELRWTVQAQAVAVVLGALTIGVPLGVVTGRLAWRAFAFQLGVVPDPSTPAVWVLVTLAGGIVVALTAAALPARWAARTTPAAALRTE